MGLKVYYCRRDWARKRERVRGGRDGNVEEENEKKESETERDGKTFCDTIKPSNFY